MDPRP